MCDFYSFLTDAKGNRYGFTREMRQAVLSGDSDLRIDSHASIAEYYFGDSRKEDNYNKFEFNPLTGKLKLDQMNLGFDDSELIDIDELMAEAKAAVSELIIKPIVHPLHDVRFEGEVADEILALLREWASVRDSVWPSVWGSVGASVEDSVLDSVWPSVWGSVGASVEDSVLASVRGSVWASVRGSVWVSVRGSVWVSIRDSVWAYTSSFFDLDDWQGIEHKPFVNPFQACIDLWEMGLVPSFAGEMWRLHSHNGIVWEGKL